MAAEFPFCFETRFSQRMCLWFRMKGKNTIFIMRHPVHLCGLRSVGAFLQEFCVMKYIRSQGHSNRGDVSISSVDWSRANRFQEKIQCSVSSLSGGQGTGALLSASIFHFLCVEHLKFNMLLSLSLTWQISPHTFLLKHENSSFWLCQQPLLYLWTQCSEMLTLHHEIIGVLGSYWQSLRP